MRNALDTVYTNCTIFINAREILENFNSRGISKYVSIEDAYAERAFLEGIASARDQTFSDSNRPEQRGALDGQFGSVRAASRPPPTPPRPDDSETEALLPVSPGSGRTPSPPPSPPPKSRPQALPPTPPDIGRTVAELKQICNICPTLRGTITEATEKRCHSLCDLLASACGAIAVGATIAELKQFNLIAAGLVPVILGGGKGLASYCVIIPPEAGGSASSSGRPAATGVQSPRRHNTEAGIELNEISIRPRSLEGVDELVSQKQTKDL
ncbi:hypothetical protein MMC30_007864 [Trapelia coarctata]|nr:hypothetical protein [Trapelia coarctata]